VSANAAIPAPATTRCDRADRDPPREQPGSRTRGQRRQRRLGDDLDDANGARQALEANRAARNEAGAVDPAGEAHHRLARKNLAGTGEAAQTCREVEGAAAVAALDRHRLAGVEPDPDSEREGGHAVLVRTEPGL